MMMDFSFNEEELRAFSNDQMKALLSAMAMASAGGLTLDEDAVPRFLDTVAGLNVPVNPVAIEDILASAKERYDAADDNGIAAWVGEVAAQFSDVGMREKVLAAMNAAAPDFSNEEEDTGVLASALGAFGIAPDQTALIEEARVKPWFEQQFEQQEEVADLSFDEEELRAFSDDQMKALLSAMAVASASGATLDEDAVPRFLDAVAGLNVPVNPVAVADILASTKERYDAADDAGVSAWLGEVAAQFTDLGMRRKVLAAMNTTAQELSLDTGVGAGPESASATAFSWNQASGSVPMCSLTVLADGTLLGVGTDRLLYTRTDLNSNWLQIPNSGDVTGVMQLQNGTIVGVGMDGALWTRATLTSGWVQVPYSGTVTAVTQLQNGTIVGVGMDGALWTRATLTSGWVQVPYSGTVIGVRGLRDGTILGVGTDNLLYSRATLDADWKQIPASGDVIAVADLPNGALVAVGTDNMLYYTKK